MADEKAGARYETTDVNLESQISSGLLNYKVPAGSDPINIAKPLTPIPGILGTPEDYRSFRGVSESPGNTMDIDVVLLLSVHQQSGS